MIKHKAENEMADHYINLLRIKTQNREQKVISLSGGNQQKVVFGKWLETHPSLLILDEPTRGVDVAPR
ncbi:hypothetical protein N752_12740 [Desulforamulus aquiferis]|nr:ATP-binding cassette domain-containing protein [Desulforamulus aquiferis]RYD04786.1 hypothetical protein N752_12740 [Desulforamulus aquiferis]